MSEEFSQQDIRDAADEVRRGGFGDFMFRDPGFDRRTTRRRTSRRRTSRVRHTSRRMTSRKVTSRKVTSRKVTSRRLTSRRQPLQCTDWCQTGRGNQLVKSCWRDGNMWVLKIKNR